MQVPGAIGRCGTKIAKQIMNTTAYYVKKTSKFIKLCKGDMSRRLKTAKLNQGRKRRVLNSRAALTRRAILDQLT